MQAVIGCFSLAGIGRQESQPKAKARPVVVVVFPHVPAHAPALPAAPVKGIRIALDDESPRSAATDSIDSDFKEF